VDFLAWAVAFLPTLTPITSFMRVLPWSLFIAVQKSSPKPSSHRDQVLVGAILGEMLSTATGRGYLPLLPMVAFEASYSYAVSRALFCGYNSRVMSSVSQGWHKARQLARSRPAPINQAGLEDVWAVIFELQDVGQLSPTYERSNTFALIVNACRVVESRGELSRAEWEQLSRGRIPLSLLTESAVTSRERRVETFEQVVNHLVRDRSDPLATDFLAGYFASLISDGSLEHAHLIFPLLERLPTAMIWYGICAGLSPRSRIMSDYGHLGVKLARMIRSQDHLLSPPTADVGLLELEMSLRGGDSEADHYRRVHASFLRVELVPMVSTVVRWSRTKGDQGSDRQLGLFEGEIPRRTQAELKNVVASLRETLEVVERLMHDESNPTRSTSRFKSKRLR
jgi:hypothetical protein